MVLLNCILVVSEGLSLYFMINYFYETINNTKTKKGRKKIICCESLLVEPVKKDFVVHLPRLFFIHTTTS